MTDDWVEVADETIHTYKAVCPTCRSTINVKQKERPLSDDALKYLIDVAHRQNQFDSYTHYFEKDGIMIDAELECDPHSLEVCDSSEKLDENGVVVLRLM